MKDVSATYLGDEQSEERQIAECYHIWSVDMASDEHQYYTSDNSIVNAQIPAVEGGVKDHTPAAIERDSVEYSTDLEITTMKIKVANITEPVIQYIANNPVELFWVSVYRVHKAHTSEYPSIIFLGQIQSVRFSGVIAEVTLAGFENYLKQTIPTYRYQKICNNSLYDTKCKLDKDDWGAGPTITNISDDELTLTVTGIGSVATNLYRYGYAEFDPISPNTKRRAMIAANTQTTITLSYKIYGLEVSDTIAVYPGCDKTLTTCDTTFSNSDNFFGMPHLSYKNPTFL